MLGILDSVLYRPVSGGLDGKGGAAIGEMGRVVGAPDQTEIPGRAGGDLHIGLPLDHHPVGGVAVLAPLDVGGLYLNDIAVSSIGHSSHLLFPVTRGQRRPPLGGKRLPAFPEFY